jgi:hypothetical protein
LQGKEGNRAEAGASAREYLTLRPAHAGPENLLAPSLGANRLLRGGRLLCGGDAGNARHLAEDQIQAGGDTGQCGAGGDGDEAGQ